MGGFFGVASQQDCVFDLFFGTDYHSHLGTRRGGMATYGENGFSRAIHNIENSPFRTKFDKDANEMKGNMGIGCISDFEPQPLLIQSHLGSFAIATVGKINNHDELVAKLYEEGASHFQVMSGGMVNATELVAALMCTKHSILAGIRYVQSLVQGSLSIMLLTSEGIYVARDRLGRTPVMIGKKDGAMCATFESFAYMNLDFEDYYELGPAEVYFFNAEEGKTIGEAAVEYMKELIEEKGIQSFKVKAKRADKNFPVKSPEIGRIIGAKVLIGCKVLKVDVHNPDVLLYVDVRHDRSYIYQDKIAGFGGLPLGTNGKGMVLLSGGIDSPVAAWMMAKRGMKLEAVHFHSYPYTSEQAKEKVIELAKILSQFTGPFNLHIVHFTKPQLEIYEKCPDDEDYQEDLNEYLSKRNKLREELDICEVSTLFPSALDARLRCLASANDASSLLCVPVLVVVCVICA